MLDYKRSAQEFLELLSRHKRVTIISHIRPDGDTISTALALYNFLKEQNITSELVCKDLDLPKEFSFLKGFDRFKQDISYSDSLVVTVDCAVEARTRFDLSKKEVVNIDHHKDNSYYGDLNIVDIEVSSTVVLYKLLSNITTVSKDVAECIYCGLLTDSQHFTSSLTTKDTFKVASELLDLGVDLTFVSNRVKKFKSLSHVRLKSKAIDSMQLFLNGRVAIMVITRDILNKTGAKYSDVIGIIDEAIYLATVEVAVLILDYENSLKVSLRSKNEDISKVAKKFGGGGHKNASGFDIKNGTIEELKFKLLDYLQKN